MKKMKVQMTPSFAKASAGKNDEHSNDKAAEQREGMSFLLRVKTGEPSAVNFLSLRSVILLAGSTGAVRSYL